MTPEERAREETWLRKHASEVEPGGLMAISPRLMDMMFPFPDATGSTPDSVDAALAQRMARVNAFLAAAGGPMPDSRPPAVPAPSPAAPEVPVS